MPDEPEGEIGFEEGDGMVRGEEADEGLQEGSVVKMHIGRGTVTKYAAEAVIEVFASGMEGPVE